MSENQENVSTRTFAPPSMLRAPKSMLKPPTATTTSSSLVSTGTTPMIKRMSVSDSEAPAQAQSSENEKKRAVGRTAPVPAAKRARPARGGAGAEVAATNSSSTSTSTSRQPLARKTATAGPSGTTQRGTKRTVGVPSKVDSSSSKPAASKRAAWDVKGRLEDAKTTIAALREQVAVLEAEREGDGGALEEKEREIETLTSVHAALESELAASKAMLAESSDAQDALRAMMGSVQAMHKQQTESLKRQVATHTTELTAIRANLATAEADLVSARADAETKGTELARVRTELEAATAKVAALESTVHDKGCRVAELEGQTASLRLTVERQVGQLAGCGTEVQSLQGRLEASDADSAAKASRIASLEADLAGCRQSIVEREAAAQAHELLRRRLHNTIQELKGNIRVFVRMRPVLPSEAARGAEHAALIQPEHTDNTELEVTESRTALVPGRPNTEKKFAFSFDRVFSEDSTQADCFEEISQLVQSALDGYNVCIFAYGQTGSGKTHTMEGSLDSEEQRGMIPRAVEQIFATSAALREKGWEYTFSASMLEIYNETLQDLLVSAAKDKKLEIKTDMEGNTTVPDLTVTPVTNPHEIHEILRKASNHRATAATLCNADSSRSHSVFQLRVSGVNADTGQSTSSLLNLIDLAGSERLAQSGSEGDRLKETQAINKSLSSLGDVIAAIGNKSKHVPYRNTKLTFLLQNSLRGQSKVLMFANVSPLAEYVSETLCTLRFAVKVNSTVVGTATAKKG